MSKNLSIIEKIENNFPSLTNSEKKVADYILRNPMPAAFATVDGISQLVKTSTTTVVRLALKLGYSGYVELQKSIQEYLKYTSSPLNKLKINLSNSADGNNIISDIASQQLENINKTYVNLSDEMILDAAKKISSARHIYIYGLRSCYGVCNYLAYNINRILGNCDCVSSYNTDYIEILRRIGPKDVIIVMSMSRYIKQVIRFAEVAHNMGAFVIAISDSYASPFVPVSDILFPIEGKSRDFHNAMTASMFFADILIGVLVMKNKKGVKTSLTETENISKIFDLTLH